MRHFETATALVGQLADSGYEVPTRVSGDSMAPGLLDGDEVRLKGVEFGDVKSGDVIAYRRGGRLVIHGLQFTLSLGGRRWLFLKGTANPRGDGPVRWEDVVGKVTGVFRDGVEIAPSPIRTDMWTRVLAWRYLLMPSPRRLLAGFSLVKGVFQ